MGHSETSLSRQSIALVISSHLLLFRKQLSNATVY